MSGAPEGGRRKIAATRKRVEGASEAPKAPMPSPATVRSSASSSEMCDSFAASSSFGAKMSALACEDTHMHAAKSSRQKRRTEEPADSGMSDASAIAAKTPSKAAASSSSAAGDFSLQTSSNSRSSTQANMKRRKTGLSSEVDSSNTVSLDAWIDPDTFFCRTASSLSDLDRSLHVQGTLRCYGAGKATNVQHFVEIDGFGQDVFIPDVNRGLAMHGDTVLITILSQDKWIDRSSIATAAAASASMQQSSSSSSEGKKKRSSTSSMFSFSEEPKARSISKSKVSTAEMAALSQALSVPSSSSESSFTSGLKLGRASASSSSISAAAMHRSSAAAAHAARGGLFVFSGAGEMDVSSAPAFGAASKKTKASASAFNFTLSASSAEPVLFNMGSASSPAFDMMDDSGPKKSGKLNKKERRERKALKGRATAKQRGASSSMEGGDDDDDDEDATDMNDEQEISSHISSGNYDAIFSSSSSSSSAAPSTVSSLMSISDAHALAHSRRTLQPVGRVVRVMSEAPKQEIVAYVRSGRNIAEKLADSESSAWILPLDARYPRMMMRLTAAPGSVPLPSHADLRNHLITVELPDRKVSFGKYAYCGFRHLFSRIDDLKAQVASLCISNRIFVADFPTPIVSELQKAVSRWTISPSDMSHRVDLRQSRCVFSIDSNATSRVLDDAISVHPVAPNVIEVSVHVADASYFVPHNSVLDTEIRKRGASLYLSDRSIPMFPTILSDLVSLHPGKDRLAISVSWHMDASSGQIIPNTQSVQKTAIKSVFKLSYAAADLALQNKSAGYSDLERRVHDDLRILGACIHARSPTISSASDVVTQLSTIANQIIAAFLMHYTPNSALLLRNPNTDDSSSDASASASSASSSAKQPEGMSESSRAALANHLKVVSLADKLSTYVCASEYPRESLRHAMIGADVFAHFTSPMRRYADLIVHRQVTSILQVRQTGDASPLQTEVFSPQFIARTCRQVQQSVQGVRRVERDSKFFEQWLHLSNNMERLSLPYVVEEAVVLKADSTGLTLLSATYGTKHRIDGKAIKKCLGVKEATVVADGIEIHWDKLVYNTAPRFELLKPNSTTFVALNCSSEAAALKPTFGMNILPNGCVPEDSMKLQKLEASVRLVTKQEKKAEKKQAEKREKAAAAAAAYDGPAVSMIAEQFDVPSFDDE